MYVHMCIIGTSKYVIIGVELCSVVFTSSRRSTINFCFSIVSNDIVYKLLYDKLIQNSVDKPKLTNTM